MHSDAMLILQYNVNGSDMLTFYICVNLSYINIYSLVFLIDHLFIGKGQVLSMPHWYIRKSKSILCPKILILTERKIS